MFQSDSQLANSVMEMGYSACSSIEECRQKLSSLIDESGRSDVFQSGFVAKILSMMIRTHTDLHAQPTINSHSDPDITSNNMRTWNVEVFVSTIQDLVLYCYQSRIAI